MIDAEEKMEANNQIRVIAYKDEGLWVAQCLEYDIGVQAKDFDSLYDLFCCALAAEYKESKKLHGKPFEGIGKAPKHFFDRWERGQVTLNQEFPVDGSSITAGLKISA